MCVCVLVFSESQVNRESTSPIQPDVVKEECLPFTVTVGYCVVIVESFKVEQRKCATDC